MRTTILKKHIMVSQSLFMGNISCDPILVILLASTLKSNKFIK